MKEKAKVKSFKAKFMFLSFSQKFFQKLMVAVNKRMLQNKESTEADFVVHQKHGLKIHLWSDECAYSETTFLNQIETFEEIISA